MKKYMILAAAAALALASCAKFETSTVSENDGNMPIGFTNYAPTSLVKAGDTYVSGTTLVENKQFAVYAWNTTYGNFLTANPGAPAFMNPAVVTWKGDTTDGDGNTYTPLRYWPSGDTPDNLSFTAYYPYGGAGITAPTFSNNTVGVYAFEAQSTPAAMVDFCVADVVNDQVYGSTNTAHDGTVNLPFKHQLAKIQFKFKTTTLESGTTIKLTDAKLQNIKTKGTLTATFTQAGTPAVNTLGSTNTTWSAQAKADTPVVYDITIGGNDVSGSNKVALSTEETTPTTADIFLMVPQDMVNSPAADEQKLVVTWEVITDGGATVTNTKTLSFKTDLKNGDDPNAAGYGAANINWAKNSFVTYTITIGPKPIYFTATVDEWATEQNGYFNVQ